MKRSNNMSLLLENGFVFVSTLDEFIDLKKESLFDRQSVFESIELDYVQVSVHEKQMYKVYQCGGFSAFICGGAD